MRKDSTENSKLNVSRIVMKPGFSSTSNTQNPGAKVMTSAMQLNSIVEPSKLVLYVSLCNGMSNSSISIQ